MNNHEDKTDDGKETSAAAFARSRGEAGHTLNHGQVGLTKKEYAAIHLRIPESGVDWLDRMVAKAEKRDIAVQIFQAVHTQGVPWAIIYQNIDTVVAAMLRAKGK